MGDWAGETQPGRPERACFDPPALVSPDSIYCECFGKVRIKDEKVRITTGVVVGRKQEPYT